MKQGDEVIIDDPTLRTNGETVYILAKVGWWLMVSWAKSPSSRFIPFVLSLSQVRERAEMKMNSLDWYRGVAIKKVIEATGRYPNLPHLAVAMILTAREQGLNMEDIVQTLIIANDYDTAAQKLDKGKTIKELGF